MVQARHDRQVARGETPVEVDVEVERLLALDAEMEPDASAEQRRRCCARRSASWWSRATTAA